MKKYLLLLAVSLFLFSTSSINGQGVNITWGKLNKPAKRGTGYNMLGEREGGVFVLKVDKKENHFIDRFNLDDLSFDFSKEIELSTKRKSRKSKDKLEYEKLLLMKENIIVFGTKYNKKLRQLQLYARRYNFDGRPNGRWEKISKIQGEKKRKRGDFNIKGSEDNKFFVVEKALPVKKKAREAFSFTVYDADLIEVYSKDDIKLIFKEKYTKLRGHKIGKDNRVYFVSINTTNHGLYSFDVNTDEKDLREFKIEFKGKKVVESAFYFDNDGNILIAGFYIKDGKKFNYGLSGTFFIKLDAKTFKPIVSNTTEFDKKFLTNFMSERRANKGKKGVPLTFDMRNFVVKADGGVIVLAESNFAVEHCTSNGPGANVGIISVGIQVCYYTYHYNEIVVLNINPDGTTNYNQLIKKRALSKRELDGALSYSIIATDKKLMVFYNDHYKNLAEGNRRIRHLPKYKKRVLAMTTITEDGEKETESLIRHSEIKLEILPRNAIVTDKGIIILGYYKKAIKLGRIEIQ